MRIIFESKNQAAVLSNSRITRFAGLVGNFLEHYDNALFALLAPFIAPLFFEAQDPLTALILTYSLLPLGVVMRPMGSLFFGWIGDYFGRRHALFLSLLGMAIVTSGMGCLPLYRHIGWVAPLLLAIGRMLQSFFAAGETAGGAIFVLEHTQTAKRGLVSSWYNVSTIGGILLASSLVAFLSMTSEIGKSWRLLFWLGGATALFGIFLRWKTTDSAEFTTSSQRVSGLKVIKDYKIPLLLITLAAGFSHTTYTLAFTLMNGYIPLVTTLSKEGVMQVNTILLVLDLCLLPCFGYIAIKWGKERLMMIGALVSAFTAIPLFMVLEQASLTTTILVRIIIILCGVAFAAPYYAWAIEIVPPRHRYLILSLGGAFGSMFIGTPSSVTCLWLYKTCGWSGAPSLYLLMTGLAAAGAVYFSHRSQEKIC